MNPLERYNDPEELFRQITEYAQTKIWTALVGSVVSYDPSQLTVEVQPTIQAAVKNPDGTTKLIDMPLFVDVPVIFPRGGNVTMTFPIQVGDECLVIIASRCIDTWWQSGAAKTQPPFEPRMHDLSDGFAIVGPFSQVTKISAVATDTVQIRSNDGATFIELDATGQAVTIVAPGGLSITGPVMIAGDVAVTGGLTTTDDTVAGTISLKTHEHSGVQAGGGTSGPPVP